MSKRRLATIVIVIGAAAIAGTTATYALAQTKAGTVPHGQMAKMNMKHSMMTETLSLEKIHTENLPIVMLSVDKAVRAIESGDKKTALAELHKARKMLITIYEAIGTQVKPQFVNNRCPIMGLPINPEKVATNLIRDYKGQKVAFCCAECPSMWDKLTDAQKQAKLAKVKPTLQKVWTCSMHPQIKLTKPGSCPLCNMKLIPVSTQ
ncbi:MAG: heavy metal-binding domain-containing protein [Planctomycetota bacterium]